MNNYEIIDRRFERLIDVNVPIRKLFGGSVRADGPVYVADGRTNMLFIAASTSLYTVQARAQGAQQP